MPPTSRRRSRSVAADGSDSDRPENARKRPRTQRVDSDGDGDEFHSVLEKPEPERDSEERPSKPAASDTEYQPGAILRVTVENFVTYNHAEFKPGPSLNMVIGPNGTGKSSLVCALCLGLGYHSNVLGRASSFGEFVKHGTDEATIEIELQKRRKDARNPIIRLRISKEDNSRQFKLNEQSTSLKEIQRLMNKFHIQIDNLCQFLPQDKVAEFAGLSPVDLLAKTLQATAPAIVTQQQQQLKEMYSRLKEYQQHMEGEADRLRVMMTKQQGLQADVDRLRERKEIEKAIEDWKRAAVLCEYEELKKEHRAAKDQKKAAEAKLRRFQESVEPALKAVNAKEQYAKDIKLCLPRLKESFHENATAADKLAKTIDSLQAKITELSTKRQAQDESIGGKKRDLGQIKRNIGDLERKIRTQEPAFDAAHWNTQIREMEHRGREIESEKRHVAEEAEQVQTAGKQASMESRTLAAQLGQLDTREGQELSRIESSFPDIAVGYKWLQEHKDEFTKEVFGPSALSCSLKDESYSSLVQSALQNDDFLCFVAQSKEDHTKLSDVFFKKLGLSVTIKTVTKPLSSYQSPMSTGDLRALGMDGFAIDYLDGPQPVLAMLCEDRKLHKYAIGKKDITEQQHEQLARRDIENYSAGSHSCKTTRRAEYGPQAVSKMTSAIKPGRFWTNQPVDNDEKKELKAKLKDTLAILTALGNRKNELAGTKANLESDLSKIAEELEKLRAAKSEQQRVYSQWKALPDRLASEKTKEARKLQEIKEVEEECQNYSDQVDAEAINLAKAMLSHREILPKMEQTYLNVIDAQIKHIEAESDVAALRAKHGEVNALLAEGERAISDLARKQDEVKERASVVSQKVFDSMSGVDQEGTARLQGLIRGKELAWVKGELEAQQSRLEFVRVANPQVIQEFERREKEIEKLQQQMAQRQNQTAELTAEIEKIRGEWEPKVDDVIRRINDAFAYNFEQISCAGEVGVHKDEDFEKWSVDIKVKFRENETLQKLDQHRQSGGERSVSTIFYLMSLQSMAQAPFRVVDEINQGMDPRNERMVHERMVDIACNEHTSQYFLITPKLLTGLRYHPRMRVLCIASGPHVPEKNKRIDFSEFVKIRKRLTATVVS